LGKVTNLRILKNESELNKKKEKSKNRPVEKEQIDTKNITGNFITKLKNNKLFRLEEYPYRVIEVQVDSRMRDKDKGYTEISNLIYSLMKDIRKRVVCNKNGVVYKACQPVSFEILYNSNKEITFNFAVNELDSLYFKSRLETILPNSTVVFRDDYLNEFIGSPVYNFHYKKHFMLSLNSKISPIQSLLAIKKDLKGEEKLLIQTLIMPVGEAWKDECRENWKKVREGQDVTNGTGFVGSVLNQLDDMANWFCELVDEILEAKIKSEVAVTGVKNRIYDETRTESRTKHNSDGFKVDIRSFIKTNDIPQDNSIASSIETCYKEMSYDNELIKGKRKLAHKIGRKMPIRFNPTLMNTLEIASLMKLPDVSLQKRFGVKNIKINQINPPKSCLEGDVKLGELKLFGKDTNIYLPRHRDVGCLPFIILTKMGGGKTTLLLNIARDTIKAGDGLIVFDYIRDCQLSKALIKMCPDINIIRFDDVEHLDNFSFPEIEIDESWSNYKRMESANIIFGEIKLLINAMATDIDDMSRPMSKYLGAACDIVFIHKDKTLLDLLDVLEDKEVRNLYIQLALAQGFYTEGDRAIRALRELDVNPQSLVRLLDRFSIITEDFTLCKMLDNPKSRVNFVDIMDNKKPILLMMPQNIFTSKTKKDVICTYYMRRINLAMNRRMKYGNTCRVMIDEGHQIPNTMKLLGNFISEPRKFSLNFIITMHSFSQLGNNDLKDMIIGAGCQFMLLKGVTETAFNELKSYVGEDFDYSDMKEMEWDFGSLNLIYEGNVHKTFMSKLPDAPIDENNKLYIGD